jgi:hypothetical protein
MKTLKIRFKREGEKALVGSGPDTAGKKAYLAKVYIDRAFASDF